MDEGFVKGLREKLAAGRLLPMERQAELSTELLLSRLDEVLPWAMEQSGIDLWLVSAREYGENAMVKTLVTWDVPHVHGLAILLFYRDPATGKIRRMCTGDQSPEMAKLYENVKAAGESEWACAARIIRELSPEKIGVEESVQFGYCDGLSATAKAELLAALGPGWAGKVMSAEELSVRWLQRMTAGELRLMELLSEVTHDIIRCVFSRRSVQVGRTTTTELEWLMRDLINAIGFDFWFGPDIDLQRRDGDSIRMFGEVIRQGDLLHCDVGIVGRFIQLNTDVQWLAYVADGGEVPAGVRALLTKIHRFQDLTMAQFGAGRTGNDIFVDAIGAGRSEGLRPMLYSHPVGTFGHGAGPSMGRYSNQAPAPGHGERPVEERTAYALELNIRADVPEWDGREFVGFAEEDIYFGGGAARFISGRQEELLVI